MPISVGRGWACIRERDVKPEVGKPVGVWGGRDISTTFKFIRNFCLGHMETGRKQRRGLVVGIPLTSSFP